MQTWQNRQHELERIVYPWDKYMSMEEYNLYQARKIYLRRRSEDMDLIMHLTRSLLLKYAHAPKTVQTFWTPEATIIDKGGHKTEMRW